MVTNRCTLWSSWARAGSDPAVSPDLAGWIGAGSCIVKGVVPNAGLTRMAPTQSKTLFPNDDCGRKAADVPPRTSTRDGRESNHHGAIPPAAEPRPLPSPSFAGDQHA